jgi:hypothetical protein
MSSQKESLGVFGALAVVLIVLGLLALAANALGWLPTF